MTTALDMITDSLFQLRVYAPGEPLSAADAALGLKSLNDMLDSWSNETLSCYTILEQSIQMVVGQQQYTVGPGGNLNGTRPLKIIDGPGAAYIMDTNNNRYPVNVVPRDKWNEIGSPKVNSNVPDTLFYDPKFPLGILNLFPVPNIGWTLFFDSYLQLVEFAGLTTQISLPPGYVEAIQTNLAVKLKRYFKSAQMDPDLLMAAREAKGNIKRTNLRENIAEYDGEIVARADGSYNIYTDRTGPT